MFTSVGPIAWSQASPDFQEFPDLELEALAKFAFRFPFSGDSSSSIAPLALTNH